MEAAATIWTPDQRYAAAALFTLALQQSQIRKTCPTNSLGSLEEDSTRQSKCESVSGASKLWVHENSGFLSHVFRFLGLDERVAEGLKETAASGLHFQDHAGTFLAVLSEEVASKNVDDSKCREKSPNAEVMSLLCNVAAEHCEGTRATTSTGSHKHHNTGHERNFITEAVSLSEVAVELSKSPRIFTEEITRPEFEKPVKEESLGTYQRKVVVLYELLCACLYYNADNDDKSSQSVLGYDARHRVALRLLATWFRINWSKVEAMEKIVASSVMDSGEKEGTEASEDRWTNWKRGGIIGAAALTGGALMAITGGMAAPGIAQGITALAPTVGSLVPAIGASGFTAAASATGSVAGSVAVAASFGAAGAGLTGYKMARRVGDINEFEFKQIGETQNQSLLAVGILISGIAFKDEDFVIPWEDQNINLERYALQWESKDLIALSTAVQDWLTSRLAMELMKDGAMMTVLSTLLSALAMPAMLVSAISLIDSQWAIAVDRSDKAGKLLAGILLQKLHGNRPVTLIGFALGARVIFRCLWFLSQTEGDNTGLVERVVLLGAPLSLKGEKWDIVRKMVAGRFINAYSTRDWTLGIIFRASLLSEGLAGIQPVDLPEVENVDVTELVEGHSSYLQKTKEILQRLDLESYYPVYKTEGIEFRNPCKERNDST